MPLAVTHVLLTIIVVGLYRDYITKHKRYFTLHTVFLAGVFGLLPDIDIVFRMFSQATGVALPELLVHGGITHTPIFGLIFLIPAFILLKMDNHKTATYFFVAAFAILFHIFLDFLIGGGAYEGVMLLFPFSMQAWKIHFIHWFNIKDIPIAMDAIILLAWLWHEEVKHKISDFV